MDAAQRELPDHLHSNHLAAMSLPERTEQDANGMRTLPARAESERDIRLTLQRQASLINLSFEPIFAWSAEGGIIEWNAGAEQLYGYTRAEALGQVSHDLLRTVHSLPMNTRLAILERDGQWTGEVRHTTKDGREVVVESRQQIIDLGGQRLILETNRDVTERWALNEALQRRTRELEEANLQLRTLLDVLPVGVAIVDAAGRPLIVNDAVRQVWGQNLPMAESAAQYGEYRAWRTDTGEPVAASDWGLARALTDGTVSLAGEYDILAFDGQRKAILDSAAPLRDASGAITGAVTAIFEITERRQFERRTRDALDALLAMAETLVSENGLDAMGLHTDGPEPMIAQAQPIARRLAELTRGLLGCSRVSISALEGEQMASRPIAVAGLTESQEAQWWEEQRAAPGRPLRESMLPAELERILSGQTATFDLTRPPYEYANPYGVTAILGAPMQAHGRIVGLLALDFQSIDGQPHVFTDEESRIALAVARLGAVVLERERLLREREAARAEVLALAEANRRMDEFLGIAGHELRTPITTIKANLQLAERRTRQALEANQPADTGEQRPSSGKVRRPLEQLLHLLERAAQSAERQERLVRDLLDISRISAGQLQYRMAPHDLAVIVREAVTEQRLSNPTRRIELEIPEEPVPVTADADRLAQVLTNYLTNALKYSEAKHPVSVTVSRHGVAARVAVRDQGPGLSAEQQRRIFVRFYRVPGIEVVSGSGVGLGLGLSISKTIIEQHGGRVGVESTPGAGSTFWFELPLAIQS